MVEETGLVEQDAAIFHRYAEYLWRRSSGVLVRWTAVGALLGAALGAVMLTPWADWPLPRREVYLLVALGAVAGGFLGRSLGLGRALGFRLQAQLAQHQLQFERSTLGRAAPVAATPSPEPATHSETPAAVAAPYVPVGAPLVSAAFDAAVVASPLDDYGWAGIEPSGS